MRLFQPDSCSSALCSLLHSWAMKKSCLTGSCASVLHCGHIGTQQESERSAGGPCLGRRVDSEAQLGLLAVVHRQALQQERAQARAGASAHSVEDKEALQTCTASLSSQNALHAHAATMSRAFRVVFSQLIRRCRMTDLEATQGSVNCRSNTLSRAMTVCRPES